MRQFAKDNDVIHVTINRQSLAQLINLTEKDIRRDENVMLVASQSDIPEEMFKDQGESGHVKTMYGTFNNMAVQTHTNINSQEKLPGTIIRA